MSETGTSLARARRQAAAARTSFALPQWAINLCRPVARGFTRLLWRVRYEGLEHLPAPAEGLIIAANHQTYIDPFWIGIPLKRPLRFLAWDEAFSWPVVGRLMELFGAWPLQVEGSDPAAIRRSLQWLKQGGGIVIFPEGARCAPDGQLQRFKPGTMRMALEAGVSVLPVTIRGGHRVWPQGWRVPHLAPVEIIYHAPFKPAPQPGEDSRRCARRETDRLADIIASALPTRAAAVAE